MHLRLKHRLSNVVKFNVQSDIVIPNYCLQLLQAHYVVSVEGFRQTLWLVSVTLLQEIDYMNQKQLQTTVYYDFLLSLLRYPVRVAQRQG